MPTRGRICSLLRMLSAGGSGDLAHYARRRESTKAGKGSDRRLCQSWLRRPVSQKPSAGHAIFIPGSISWKKSIPI